MSSLPMILDRNSGNSLLSQMKKYNLSEGTVLCAALVFGYGSKGLDNIWSWSSGFDKVTCTYVYFLVSGMMQ